MSKVIKFRSDQRVAQGAMHAQDAFVGSPMYAGMRKIEDKVELARTEVAAVEAMGAGGQSTNPLKAPSWQPLLDASKRGCTLREVLEVVLRQGRSNGDEFTSWGILQTYPYGEKEDALKLSLDISEISPAGEIFEAAGIKDWRARIANDALALKITGTAEVEGQLLYRTAKAAFVIPGVENKNV